MRRQQHISQIEEHMQCFAKCADGLMLRFATDYGDKQLLTGKVEQAGLISWASISTDAAFLMRCTAITSR